jgi:PEP-CTERM motif-containing protein
MNTRNLSGKNAYPRPLGVLGLIMGSFMLMTLAAPSAHAVNLLVYYNFNQGAISPPNTNPFPTDPYESVAPGSQIGVDLSNTAAAPGKVFPSGNLQYAATFDAGVVNKAPGDLTTTIGAIDARGNTTGLTGMYCFTIGAFSTSGQTNINLSFALMSVADGFQNIDLLYSTNGTIFTEFGSIANVTGGAFATWAPQSFSLPTGANNQSTVFIEFCFSNVKDNNTHNNTYIDNIQITGVPEPGTVIGGALGVLGLCWSQRRWLVRSLRLRRT